MLTMMMITTSNTETMHLNDLKMSSTTLGDINATQVGSIAAGQKAQAEMLIKSTFSGTKSTYLRFDIPGYDAGYNFSIIGETSNVDSTPENVIKITGAADSAAATTQIVDGINDFISNNPDTELHSLEFVAVGDKIQVTSKDEGTLGNRSNIYTDQYGANLISSNNNRHYQYFSGGTDTSTQMVIPGKCCRWN